MGSPKVCLVSMTLFFISGISGQFFFNIYYSNSHILIFIEEFTVVVFLIDSVPCVVFLKISF